MRPTQQPQASPVPKNIKTYLRLSAWSLFLAAFLVSGCAGGRSRTITYNFDGARTGGTDIFSAPGVLVSGTAVFASGAKKQKLQFMALRQGADLRLKFFTGLSGPVMEMLITGNTYAAAFSGRPDLVTGNIRTDRIRLPETDESLPVAVMLYALRPDLDAQNAALTRVGRDTIATEPAPDGLERRIKTGPDGRISEQSFGGRTLPVSVLYSDWDEKAECPHPTGISIVDSQGRELAALTVRACKLKTASGGADGLDPEAFAKATQDMRKG